MTKRTSGLSMPIPKALVAHHDPLIAADPSVLHTLAHGTFHAAVIECARLIAPCKPISPPLDTLTGTRIQNTGTRNTVENVKHF